MQVQVTREGLLQEIGLLTVENKALRAANTVHAKEAEECRAAVAKAEEEIIRLREKCGETGTTLTSAP